MKEHLVGREEKVIPCMVDRGTYLGVSGWGTGFLTKTSRCGGIKHKVLDRDRFYGIISNRGQKINGLATCR